jgi:hypothetical protein
LLIKDVGMRLLSRQTADWLLRRRQEQSRLFR